MRYIVYQVDAFTGHIFHPDGSGRVMRDGDPGFHETFETREEAMHRKDVLMRTSGVTEVLVTAEDKSEASVFQNQEEIQRLTEERKKNWPNQRPQGTPPSVPSSSTEPEARRP